MLTERHVQAIWYDATLRPRQLFTRRGSEVNVISPGDWNLEAGPDFLHAVLEIGRDRQRVVGDVEIHLCPSDWDFHSHGSDPNYRNVIAHVTWGCGPEPSTLPPNAVSIWLGRFVNSNPSFSLDSIDLTAYPFARLPMESRPCERALAGDVSRAHEILAAAGRHRLRMKARRLAGLLCERGPGDTSRRQVYYEEIMAAFGYKRNSPQFRHVAERVPLDVLPRDCEAARNALLVAGSFETWNNSGVRPFNAPSRRLADAAVVFTESPVLDFASANDFSEKNCRRMVRALHMGTGRASALLANVLVPFALAEERIGEVPSWLPPEDVSSPVRLTANRLFGRDHNPAAFYSKNGLFIQGLLQIHRDYCLRNHPACEKCDLLKVA